MSALADYSAFHTTETQRHDWAPGCDDDRVRRRPLLDKPSDPHPILSALMDEALTRILLTADGAVMPLKERTTGSKATSSAPTSALAETLDGLTGRFTACKTHRARMLVIVDAQMTADRLQYAPRAEQRGTLEWKQAIGHDERPCRIVASVYGVSLRDVVSYRKQFRVTRLADRKPLP